jgi:hypothetical protein
MTRDGGVVLDTARPWTWRSPQMWAQCGVKKHLLQHGRMVDTPSGPLVKHSCLEPSCRYFGQVVAHRSPSAALASPLPEPPVADEEPRS